MSGKPVLDIGDVVKIARDVYEFEACHISELVSYDDKNFHLKGHWNTHGKQQHGSLIDVLLKITGRSSHERSELDIHNRLMLYLKNKAISVQTPLKSKSGELITDVELPFGAIGPEKRRHHVRLLTYIPGQTWQSMVPLSEQNYLAMGMQCAHLQTEMNEFAKHLESPIIEHKWSLINAPQVLRHLDVITDEGCRNLAQDVLLHFERIYVPRLNDTKEKWVNNIPDDQFPIGLIHGDLNDLNILVQSASVESFKAPTFGFLDWEDCAITRRSYDLAVLLMSMLCCENPTNRDVIGLGSALLRGFQYQLRQNGSGLTREELNAMPIFVATRFAQSLISGAYTYQVLSPGNEYVLMTTKQDGWKKLEDIWLKRRSLYQDTWVNVL